MARVSLTSVLLPGKSIYSYSWKYSLWSLEVAIERDKTFYFNWRHIVQQGFYLHLCALYFVSLSSAWLDSPSTCLARTLVATTSNRLSSTWLVSPTTCIDHISMWLMACSTCVVLHSRICIINQWFFNVTCTIYNVHRRFHLKIVPLIHVTVSENIQIQISRSVLAFFSSDLHITWIVLFATWIVYLSNQSRRV